MGIYDKPYSKSIKKPVINWAEIVAEKNNSMFVQSGSWATCAVGQLTSEITRLKSHAPLDITLAGYGLDFATAYMVEDWANAKVFLNKIESRAKELLNI